jgi:hypothetical protein
MEPITGKLNEAIREVIPESWLEAREGEIKIELKTTLTEHVKELEEPREIGKVRPKLIYNNDSNRCGSMWSQRLGRSRNLWKSQGRVVAKLVGIA